jgi:hypothetical protein
VSEVAAHDQLFVHKYIVHYPDHDPRPEDPYYRTFEAWRKAHRDPSVYKCHFGVERGGDFSECDLEHPLEAHHSKIELAMMNEVDFTLLEKTFPGISTPKKLGTWMNSTPNLMWLCRWHHRGHGGEHSATYSDYTAEHYVRHLIR